MENSKWVNLVSGTPVLRDFLTTDGQGAPFVIDIGTGTGYYLNTGDVVTALAGGGGGGSGTVTSVSVTTANGVSGSVATATTTPAITLTLGAITPSSVAASGTVAGSNLSGVNTGDQTITLTGNVTGSGTGSFATTIPAGTITLAMQANMATASVVYRKTAGAGAPEVQTLATLKTDLGLTGTNSGDQTITLTGDITGSGTGSFSASIGANKVTRGMLAATSGAAFLGATGAANVSDLTGTQATTLLDVFTSALKGLAPSSGGGTTNFLRADGTWAVPPGGTGATITGTPASGNLTKFSGASSITNGDLAGDVTTSGTLSTTIAAASVSLAKMANLAANSIIGNNTGAGATPTALTPAQTKTLLAIANTDVSGLGTMATQNANAVAITGGAYNGTVGATTPSSGVFTTLGWTGVKYTAAGSALGPTIADYFTSTISLDASSVYNIEAVAYFLKTTAGPVTWTWTFSSAPNVAQSFYSETPITGFTTSVVTGAPVVAQAAIQSSTILTHAGSGSLTTAVYHVFRFNVIVFTNAATTIQLRVTSGFGTVTPQAGSFMRATKVL